MEVLSEIPSKHDDVFELPKLPDYASSTSWYSYKPKLKSITLGKLKEAKLWKFSEFGYPAIASHPYWEKDKDFFPFSTGIQPETRLPLQGHDEYLKDRVTLSLPTVRASYWTKENIKTWDKTLTDLIEGDK